MANDYSQFIGKKFGDREILDIVKSRPVIRFIHLQYVSVVWKH